MASEKKRRKAVKANQPRPAGPFRHPDGDRRRRGGPSAKDAIRNKQLQSLIGAVDLPEEEAEDRPGG